jgi:hypothetical protein
MGLMVFPAVVYAVRKTSIWPNTILGFLAIGVPVLLIGLLSWNRLIHPERVPVRWSRGYPLGERLKILETALNCIWVLGLCVSWAINEPVHSTAYITIAFIFCGAAGWSGFLRGYIEDRKYIPPPRQDPSGGWAGAIKGIYSEHWDGREVPKVGTNEP